MLLTSLRAESSEFATRTGWEAKPEGLCQGEVCVPAPGAIGDDGMLDVEVIAERLRMPLVHDTDHGLWALGPPAEGPALANRGGGRSRPRGSRREPVPPVVAARPQGAPRRLGQLVRMP